MMGLDGRAIRQKYMVKITFVNFFSWLELFPPIMSVDVLLLEIVDIKKKKIL